MRFGEFRDYPCHYALPVKLKDILSRKMAEMLAGAAVIGPEDEDNGQYQ